MKSVNHYVKLPGGTDTSVLARKKFSSIEALRSHCATSCRWLSRFFRECVLNIQQDRTQAKLNRLLWMTRKHSFYESVESPIFSEHKSRKYWKSPKSLPIYTYQNYCRLLNLFFILENAMNLWWSKFWVLLHIRIQQNQLGVYKQDAQKRQWKIMLLLESQ